MRFGLLISIGLCVLLTACIREQPTIVVVTATSSGDVHSAAGPIATNVSSSTPAATPTANIARATATIASALPVTYTVQAGDTLFVIAQRFNTSIDAILALNALSDANLLQVGQVLQLPAPPSEEGPANPLLADIRLIRYAEVSAFNSMAFVIQQGGYIQQASDTVTNRLANGAGFNETLLSGEILERISIEYRVDPRLLLVLLEMRAVWLSETPSDPLRLDYPLTGGLLPDGIERKGLYRQLAWAANELNRAYYRRKYGSLTVLEFSDGQRLNIANQLNAASVAVQYLLSINRTRADWQSEVEERFTATYQRYFGDPLDGLGMMPFNNPLEQPTWVLPWLTEEAWYYTGGPHGGWGSGSAWAAVDFAPPDVRLSGDALCYTSQYAVRAISDGLVVYSDHGMLLLDTDGDGDDATGWVIQYLHLDDATLVPVQSTLKVGDVLGFSSCQGGFSTATHLHIGRIFNGEWIPADCGACGITPFTMAGWQVASAGAEYQGYLINGTIQKVAEQGRESDINVIVYP